SMGSLRRLSGALLLVILPIASADAAHEGHRGESVAVAKAHLESGMRYFQQNDYAKALEEFEAGHKPKALPALEDGMARCFEIMERYSEAVAAYERYLKESQKAKDADKVRATIAELKTKYATATKVGEKTTVPVVGTKPPTASPPTASTPPGTTTPKPATGT